MCGGASTFTLADVTAASAAACASGAAPPPSAAPVGRTNCVNHRDRSTPRVNRMLRCASARLTHCFTEYRDRVVKNSRLYLDPVFLQFHIVVTRNSRLAG